MMRIWLFLLCMIFPFGTLQAQSTDDAEQSFSDNISFVAEPQKITKKQGIVLYNFSTDLLNAAADCLPYSEDFTKTNPDLNKLLQSFGYPDMQIMIDIQGIINDHCYVTVSAKILGISGQRIVCALDGDQHRALLKAMHDRSKNKVTGSWQITSSGEEQEQIQKTMTGSRFDVTIEKLKDTVCQTEKLEPSKEEVAVAQAKMNLFSGEFLNALQNCRPAIEKRDFFKTHFSAEILGIKDNTCHIKYKLFDLNVPLEMTTALQGFSDLDRLLKNNQISSYDYKQHYLYDGLLFELEYCRKHKTKHNGLNEKINYNDEADIEKGIMSEVDEDNCLITFINKLYYAGKQTDYSVVCSVPTKKADAFITEYADILQKYGEKSIGGAEDSLFEPAEHNDETIHADGLILADIQMQGLCHRIEPENE